MSKAISASTMGPSRWSYTAFIMERVLGDIIKSGGKAKIPADLWRDAQKFFHIVLEEGLGDATSDKPPIQFNTYHLARTALNSCGELRCETQEETNSYFQRFAALLELDKSSKTIRPLDSEGLKTVKELQRFFVALYQLGERENARD